MTSIIHIYTDNDEMFVSSIRANTPTEIGIVAEKLLAEHNGKSAVFNIGAAHFLLMDGQIIPAPDWANEAFINIDKSIA